MLETLAEYMVYVTIQQMVGYVNVPQGLLVITAVSVRKSPKKKKTQEDFPKICLNKI